MLIEKPQSVPSMSRDGTTYLGFDFGVKKIGVAVGDSETGLAHGVDTLRAIQQRPNWEGIEKLIETWQPVGLVVGLSTGEAGQDNLVTPRMRKFSRQLEGRYHLPVYLIDEQLTTFEAKQMLFEELQVSADTLWAKQDQLAAQLILSTWLEHNKKGMGAT